MPFKEYFLFVIALSLFNVLYLHLTYFSHVSPIVGVLSNRM